MTGARPLSRIPLVDPDDLTPAQAEIYRSSPSGKLNIFRLLAHASTLHEGFSKFAQGIFATLTIPPVEREIIVLAVLHLDRGEYEWAQHVQIARVMGISQAKIDAIANDRFGADIFDHRELALLAFTRQVVKCVRVDDFVFAAVSGFYTPRQMVEAMFTIGNYMMILRISEVAELEVDAVLGADVVRAAEEMERARRIAE